MIFSGKIKLCSEAERHFGIIRSLRNATRLLKNGVTYVGPIKLSVARCIPTIRDFYSLQLAVSYFFSLTENF